MFHLIKLIYQMGRDIINFYIYLLTFHVLLYDMFN